MEIIVAVLRHIVTITFEPEKGVKGSIVPLRAHVSKNIAWEVVLSCSSMGVDFLNEPPYIYYSHTEEQFTW